MTGTARPCRSAFWADRAFPAADRGPVLRRAFARLVAVLSAGTAVQTRVVVARIISKPLVIFRSIVPRPRLLHRRHDGELRILHDLGRPAQALGESGTVPVQLAEGPFLWLSAYRSCAQCARPRPKT